MPVVSVLIVVGLQVVMTRDSGSVTFQETTALLRYQPLLPWVPFTIEVTVGAVLSTLKVTMPAFQSLDRFNVAPAL